MQKMTMLSLLRALVSLVVIVGLFGLIGCGSDGGESKASHEVDPKSIQACLKRAGAIEATTSGELEFLAEAEGNEEVSKPAFAYDREAGILVDIWSKAGQEGRPSEWIIWIGHSSPEVPSPEEVLSENPPHSFVMYVDQPSRSVRHGVEGCIRLGG